MAIKQHDMYNPIFTVIFFAFLIVIAYNLPIASPLENSGKAFAAPKEGIINR